MNKFRSSFSSLRFRLTVWYVLVLAVVLVAFSLILYNTIQISQRNEFEAKLMATADLIVNKEESAFSPALQVSEIPLKEEIFYQQYNQFGQVINHSPNLTEYVIPISEASRRAVLREQTYLEYTTLPDGKKIALVTQGYRILGGEDLGGILQVGASFSRVEESLGTLRFWLWVVVPTTLLLTSLGGIFLADRLLKPLAKIIESAREIGSRNLDQRLPISNPNDELGRLAITLNSLFDRLENSFKNQQRFIADASHELRTPMAAMRAEIEVAMRRERERDEYKSLIGSNLEEVKRLARMAERLLFLTQSDAGKLPLREEKVHLDELCRRVVEKLGLLAKDRKICLSADQAMPVSIDGDRELLEQVLMILVENALKYTPEDGAITLSCGTFKKKAWLEVTDTGQGIPEQHLPHLFERFYRVDKARSREEGGTGLGLSIAHSIAAAHGGYIKAQSTLGEGTTFRVYIPFPEHRSRLEESKLN